MGVTAPPEEEGRVWWSRLVRDADQIVGPARAVCWFLADVVPRASLASVMARAVRGLSTINEADLAAQIKDVLAEVDPPTDPRHEGISRSLLRDDGEATRD